MEGVSSHAKVFLHGWVHVEHFEEPNLCVAALPCIACWLFETSFDAHVVELLGSADPTKLALPRLGKYPSIQHLHAALPKSLTL